MSIVVQVLDEVRDTLTALSSALSPPKKGRRSSSGSSNNGVSSLDVGKRGRALMDDHHAALGAVFQEEAKYVEGTLSKQFAQQQLGIEQQLAYVTFKGDRLLFCMKLADARARHLFDLLHRPPHAQSGSDLWLLEARYAVAAARSYEVRAQDGALP